MIGDPVKNKICFHSKRCNYEIKLCLCQEDTNDLVFALKWDVLPRDQSSFCQVLFNAEFQVLSDHSGTETKALFYNGSHQCTAIWSMQTYQCKHFCKHLEFNV